MLFPAVLLDPLWWDLKTSYISFFIKLACSLPLSSRNLLLLLDWSYSLGTKTELKKRKKNFGSKMYTIMCHVTMSHIVLPLFSHNKTDPTSSHQLSQIVPVCYFKLYILEQFLFILYLMDPRGAGHVEAFQFLSLCACVCMSVCLCVCVSGAFIVFYSATFIVAQSLVMGWGVTFGWG